MLTNNLPSLMTGQVEMTRTSVSITEIISHTGWVGLSVLLVLILFSVISWGIMVHKLRLFGVVRQETGEFRDQFYRRGAQLEQLYNLAKRMKTCPMARVFLAGYIELAAQFRVTAQGVEREDEELLLEKLDSISRSLERATAIEVTRLERWLFFLGTTGSTAPFIGLFGTVWGVMEAFAAIGATGAASVAVVAPGISEALIATAAGLFAAIPAVMGYNYFVHRVNTAATDLDNFSLDMLSLIDRVYLKRSA